jgi:hypothetical protein
MTTAIPSTDIVVSVEPLFTDAERAALAGFLAGYSGLTRDAYALDLRMFTAWCQQHGLHLFRAWRADIECFGRDMETRGRPRANHRAQAVHDRRLLSLRGRGGVSRVLSRGPRQATAAGLRVTCDWPGPE